MQANKQNLRGISESGRPCPDLFQVLHEHGWLEPLLADKTTGHPIIWATDTYVGLGNGYGRLETIKPELLIGRQSELAAIRSQKRLHRTRKHGEVATPSFVCKLMCDNACAVLATPDWREFVAANVLEITCGTAPFLASPRNGVAIQTGVGLLDRKLRLIEETTKSKVEWLEWIFRAFQSTYGYEVQGDNLLQARINLLEAFRQTHFSRFGEDPAASEMKRIIDILTWNLWQMDGLSGAIPFAEAPKPSQADLFDSPATQNQSCACKIMNWQTGKIIPWTALEQTMKSDFIIGNPPYQKEKEGTSAKPVYNYYMDAAYKLADKVELITPARFLFDTGKTPKAWNWKMLDDPHLKVLAYWDDASDALAGMKRRR